MLDRYIMGEARRLSPEAPVPVVNVTGRKVNAGGAANVASNVAGVRAKVTVLGVAGNDAAGRKLIRALEAQRIDTSYILIDSNRPTTAKTRLVSGSHQIARFDDEINEDLAPQVADRLLSNAYRCLNSGVKAIILSDYAKGVLTQEVVRAIISAARSRNVPVFVDPKHPDYTRYSGATCVTPNLKEFTAAAQTLGIGVKDLTQAAFELRTKIASETLLVTRGAQGMTLFDHYGPKHFPALAEQVFDVSGAGDTVIATIATATASGLPLHLAISLANVAASIVIEKIGTVPVRWRELVRRAEIGPWPELSARLLADHCSDTFESARRGHVVR